MGVGLNGSGRSPAVALPVEPDVPHRVVASLDNSGNKTRERQQFSFGRLSTRVEGPRGAHVTWGEPAAIKKKVRFPLAPSACLRAHVAHVR